MRIFQIILLFVVAHTTNLWFKKFISPLVKDFSLVAIHECLLHVDEVHCGKQIYWLIDLKEPTEATKIVSLTEESVQTPQTHTNSNQKNQKLPIGTIQLSESEQTVLIKQYALLDKEITTKSSCTIGVGYNNCEDIGFRAKDLFTALEKEINEIGTITPKIHSKISNLQEFVETFIKHFSEGVNGEYVSQNKDLFFLLLNRLQDAKIQTQNELGGHSSVWAIRSQMEGCKVYVTPAPSSFNLNSLKTEKAANYLMMPETLDRNEEVQKHDIHLVFEYNEGDQILGFTAPRSNRLYFVHDPNGGQFLQMDQYHSQLDSVAAKPYRHMFGGYQLLQKLSQHEANERLSQMANLWAQLRRDRGPNGEQHMIHVEFGHFSNQEIFELFDKYAVRNADSLGMNEVEMKLLIDAWTDESRFINTDQTIETVLQQTAQLFEIAREKDLPLSRVHLHPYGSFVMCYRKSIWEDANDAIIKSSIVLPKYCIRNSDGTTPDDWVDQSDNFQVPEMPESFSVRGQKIQIKKDRLHYNFELTNEVDCYLQFFLKCKQVFKTAGMGDTISGTGFIYHEPKIAPL